MSDDVVTFRFTSNIPHLGLMHASLLGPTVPYSTVAHTLVNTVHLLDCPTCTRNFHMFSDESLLWPASLPGTPLGSTCPHLAPGTSKVQ